VLKAIATSRNAATDSRFNTFSPPHRISGAIHLAGTQGREGLERAEPRAGRQGHALSSVAPNDSASPGRFAELMPGKCGRGRLPSQTNRKRRIIGFDPCGKVLSRASPPHNCAVEQLDQQPNLDTYLNGVMIRICRS
jgi:hypothetical protein